MATHGVKYEPGDPVFAVERTFPDGTKTYQFVGSESGMKMALQSAQRKVGYGGQFYPTSVRALIFNVSTWEEHPGSQQIIDKVKPPLVYAPSMRRRDQNWIRVERVSIDTVFDS